LISGGAQRTRALVTGNEKTDERAKFAAVELDA